MSLKICPKCQSDKTIPRAGIEGMLMSWGNINAVIYENAEAAVFKGTQSRSIARVDLRRMRLCGVVS
jgi:hypothetical protein